MNFWELIIAYLKFSVTQKEETLPKSYFVDWIYADTMVMTEKEKRREWKFAIEQKPQGN